MASDEGKKVTLKSSDGEEFVVEETVAMESQTIRHMIEDGCADSAIPLPNVNSKILSKVIEYCKKHVESAAKPSVAGGGDEKTAEEDLNGWDSEFVKVNQATLFDLIWAANYLNIKGLVRLTCQTVVDTIKGKTPEEIHEFFNLNEITPKEEEEIRRENQGAFEEEEEEECFLMVCLRTCIVGFFILYTLIVVLPFFWIG